MLSAGIITPGTSIVMPHRGTDHWAEIDADGGIVLRATGGTPFDKVDDAGADGRFPRRRPTTGSK